jgi:hypothetical protein
MVTLSTDLGNGFVLRARLEPESTAAQTARRGQGKHLLRFSLSDGRSSASIEAADAQTLLSMRADSPTSEPKSTEQQAREIIQTRLASLVRADEGSAQRAAEASDALMQALSRYNDVHGLHVTQLDSTSPQSVMVRASAFKYIVERITTRLEAAPEHQRLRDVPLAYDPVANTFRSEDTPQRAPLLVLLEHLCDRLVDADEG